MQKAGIVEAQQRAEHGVLLVAGARDGVVAEIALLQFARRHVEQSARQLVLEDLERLARGERSAGAERIGGRKALGWRFGCGK